MDPLSKHADSPSGRRSAMKFLPHIGQGLPCADNWDSRVWADEVKANQRLRSRGAGWSTQEGYWELALR